MNSIATQHNDEARSEMDDLLHDYFQAEMPHPWPTFKAPREARSKTQASIWSRYSGRLALAACVGVLIVGYLTLGTFFPQSQVSPDLQKATGDVGYNPRDPKSVRPKANDSHHEEVLPTPMGTQSTPR